MLKPMLPTLTFETPHGKEWVYETKYDGFRAILIVDKDIKMISRNGKDLLQQFPEAKNYLKMNWNKISKYSPFILDGELCILTNPYKSDFSAVQTRGRMRSERKIQEAIDSHRAKLLVFDLLQYNGKDIKSRPFKERKDLLTELFSKLALPIVPSPDQKDFLQMIPYESEFHELWRKIQHHDGEGIIVKHLDSKWEEGKRSGLWLKYKNWKKVHVFITAYEKTNGYFHVGVFHEDKIKQIGIFKNGMTKEETSALVQIIKQNSTQEDDQFIYVAPAICVELNFLELFEDGLREPYFSKFLLSESPDHCTWIQFRQKEQAFPVEITHPDKPLYKNKPITKLDYLTYLKFIYPYISAFLLDRTLTVIRYPHGTFGEAFFQKNCPEYAPEFVKTYHEDGIEYIVCNSLDTYLWLGNQLAIEFHIPYRTLGKKHPSEIVIDLDPPTRKEFPWAVEAALYIKEDIVDKLGLHAFIKVSGNRGLQIYFPLPEEEPITWDDSRTFTEFIANYLLAKNENHFTIERLKKNRHNRLYIDYVQHAEGKTIICPYSLRGNENAGVAAPLLWEELQNNELTPDGFSLTDVMNRVKTIGNPFQDFFTVKEEQPIHEVIKFLKK